MLASQRSDHELMSKEQIREGSKQLPLMECSLTQGTDAKALGEGVWVFAEQHGVQCDWGWVSKEGHG